MKEIVRRISIQPWLNMRASVTELVSGLSRSASRPLLSFKPGTTDFLLQQDKLEAQNKIQLADAVEQLTTMSKLNPRRMQIKYYLANALYQSEVLLESDMLAKNR